MTFEWDEKKNKLNKKKHGVSFEIATGVFLDAFRIERMDIKHSGNEDRFYIIGKAVSILFVVYTERLNNIRIISARQATKEEVYEYYKENDYWRS